MISGLYLSSENYQVYNIDFNPILWAGFCKFGLLEETATPNNYTDSRIEICVDKYKGIISASTYCVNDYNSVWPNDNEHIINMQEYSFNPYYKGLFLKD